MITEGSNKPVSACAKWSVFIGIYLLRLFGGVPYIWGNLVVYTTSYLYASGKGSTTAAGPWLINIYLFGVYIGLFLVKPLTQRCGFLIPVFIMTLIFNGSILLTYYAVQNSYSAICVAFGIMGISGGITEASQFMLIVRWTTDHTGISSSSVSAFSVLGAVLVNLIITFYINPANLKAELLTDNMKLFDQQELLERVPYAFLVYGGASLGVNCIGLLLIRDKPSEGNVVMKIIGSIKRLLPSGRNSGNDNSTEVGFSTRQYTVNANNDVRIGGSLQNENDFNHDLTLKQALKTKEFWTLSIAGLIAMIHSISVNTYYKVFGLLYIHDDHFLTSIGVWKCILAPVAIFLGGYSIDRFGVKVTMVSLTSLTGILVSFFSMTPIVSKWLYFFWCLSYGCFVFTSTGIAISCCVKLFGETHMATIYGMLWLPSFVLTPFSPLLMEEILASWGWLIYFMSFGALSLLVLVLIIFLLPDKMALVQID